MLTALIGFALGCAVGHFGVEKIKAWVSAEAQTLGGVKKQ